MKKKHIIIIILSIFFFSILFLIKFVPLSYNIAGTYSAGNEPSMDNIYIVLHDERFTIYNQKKLLATGIYQKLELNSKSDIYKLVSDKDITTGYIVYENNNIVLLDFMDIDIKLEKISKNAIYLDVE